MYNISAHYLAKFGGSIYSQHRSTNTDVFFMHSAPHSDATYCCNMLFLISIHSFTLSTCSELAYAFSCKILILQLFCSCSQQQSVALRICELQCVHYFLCMSLDKQLHLHIYCYKIESQGIVFHSGFSLLILVYFVTELAL